MPTFTTDCTIQHFPNWKEWLAPFADVEEIQALEIGSFEGCSAFWFLENILTHPSSHLTCIDQRIQPLLRSNLESYLAEERLTLYEGLSFYELCALHNAEQPPCFDFIHVDGGHTSANALGDCVLCFPLLKVGGIMILDDYEWTEMPTQLQLPKIGINSFLSAYEDRYDLVHAGYQICLRKTQEVEYTHW